MAKEGAKQEHAPAPEKKEAPSPKGKGGPAQAPGGCLSWGCKHPESRFGFCNEHYDHFKFGLIKKNGEQVPDYEKKFGHWLAHKAKRGTQKAA